MARQKHHMIDQRGQIVTMRNDKSMDCKGCCYEKYKKDKQHLKCIGLVPVEHVLGEDSLYCIQEEIIIYKEI